jgi:TonB family protein
MKHGKRIHFSMIALAILALAGVLVAETQNPVCKTRAFPRYPEELYREKIGGQVLVEFIVGADGKVHDAHVIQSTHPKFNASAVAAIRRWTFEPGVKDGKKIDIRARQTIDFNVPRRRLMRPFAEADKPGAATIDYWLDENLQLTRVEVVKASSRAFGKAAVASIVDACEYEPSQKAGSRPGRNQLNLGVGGPGEMGAFAKEILKKLAMRAPSFLAESELDQPLVILFQEPALHPPSLFQTHPSGRALVEFVVDPEGLVQWPRVIEATHEDFGYAAAQAVGQWLYQPPKHQGKPASVLVRQLVEFHHP